MPSGKLLRNLGKEESKMVVGEDIGNVEKCFLANIYSSDDELIAQGIRTRLILNEIRYTEPITFLYPSCEEEYDAITAYSEINVNGYFENAAGEKIGEVRISKGHLNPKSLHYGTSWREYVIEVVSPEEMYEKRHLEIQNQDKSHILFFLNDNRIFFRTLVTPPCYPAVAQALPKVILDVGDGWAARFERHYNHAQAKFEGIKGGFVSGYLVLALEKSNHRLSSIDDVKPISGLVSQLLWYLSFASRHRTTWIKWHTVIGTDYVQYYRRIYIRDKYSEYGEPLISANSVQSFLQHCLGYIKDGDNLNLYLPIVNFVSANDPSQYMESAFLSLFMALEALLMLYAKSQGKTKYFNGELWNGFKSHMRSAIKSFSNMSDSDRSFILGRIGYFNEKSRKMQYDDFCKDMGVDNSKLWPVFTSRERPSLYYIRNKLAHGESFEDGYVLGVARCYLQWIVERCLLATLGWNGHTDVDDDILRRDYMAYHDWRQYCK